MTDDEKVAAMHESVRLHAEIRTPYRLKSLEVRHHPDASETSTFQFSVPCNCSDPIWGSGVTHNVWLSRVEMQAFLAWLGREGLTL